MTRNLSATEAKRLQREWRRRTEAPLGLILDNVMTPFNVGAIFRTAAALRVDQLWLTGSSATPEHDKTKKTSLGTERLVAWTVSPTVEEAASEATRTGMRVVGVELAQDALPLPQAPLGGGVCLVLGHEDRGLSNAALGACEAFTYIPTPGKVGSLNVATAAAIALYEVRRREWLPPPPQLLPVSSDAEGVDLEA